MFVVPFFDVNRPSASQAAIRAATAVIREFGIDNNKFSFIFDAAFSSIDLRTTLKQMGLNYTASANTGWDSVFWDMMKHGLLNKEYRVLIHTTTGLLAFCFRDKDSKKKGKKYYCQFTNSFRITGATPALSPAPTPAPPLGFSPPGAKILLDLSVTDLRCLCLAVKRDLDISSASQTELVKILTGFDFVVGGVLASSPFELGPPQGPLEASGSTSSPGRVPESRRDPTPSPVVTPRRTSRRHTPIVDEGSSSSQPPQAPLVPPAPPALPPAARLSQQAVLVSTLGTVTIEGRVYTRDDLLRSKMDQLKVLAQRLQISKARLKKKADWVEAILSENRTKVPNWRVSRVSIFKNVLCLRSGSYHPCIGSIPRSSMGLIVLTSEYLITTWR